MKAAHIARAALQGIAFQVSDVLKAMESDSGLLLKELRVDGGAVKDNLLMQMQADLLSVPVTRPVVTELTALGVAFLAGLAIKFWRDRKEIQQFWQTDRIFSPTLSQEQIRKAHDDWKRAVRCAKAWEL